MTTIQESISLSESEDTAITVRDLTKVYGGSFRAVDGINFDVRRGEVFGLLGPNGAGKTTTIKIITTLIAPTSGEVKVFGIDVTSKPQEVRQSLGYVPQAISVDGDLSAYENLLIFSKLFYVSREDRDSRIASALEYMGLAERKDDLVKHYSGGMMRRLEIAQALVNRPKVLILDEPSIGLDPSSKKQMLDYIKRLNKDFKTTVLITTHDMIEADELCDRLAIMDHGKIAVIGKPKDLKKSVGGEIITVTLARDQSEAPESSKSSGISSIFASGFPKELGTLVSIENSTIKILVENGDRAIPRIIDYFERNSIGVDAISLSKPTLDDVFMKYANVSLESAGRASDTRSVRRTFTRRSG